jgi:hypothetical protein
LIELLGSAEPISKGLTRAQVEEFKKWLHERLQDYDIRTKESVALSNYYDAAKFRFYAQEVAYILAVFEMKSRSSLAWLAAPQVRCPRCLGTGAIYSQTDDFEPEVFACPDCQGEGFIKKLTSLDSGPLEPSASKRPRKEESKPE